MLITSSRKPSINTRQLCKVLASFFKYEYINRGKRGIKETLSLIDHKYLLIVGEYHGNPGSLVFYDRDGNILLSIRISVSFFDKSISLIFNNNNNKLLIRGTSELTFLLGKILEIEIKPDILSTKVLEVKSDSIHFLYENKLILKLNIRNVKIGTSL